MVRVFASVIVERCGPGAELICEIISGSSQLEADSG
jgi:hypothetical protein